MFSASMQPLTVKTTSPFVALVILSIHPLLRLAACLTSVTHLRIGNCGANIKLLKIGVLMENAISIFRRFSKFRIFESVLSGAREEPNPKGDLWRNPES